MSSLHPLARTIMLPSSSKANFQIKYTTKYLKVVHAKKDFSFLRHYRLLILGIKAVWQNTHTLM